VILALDPSGASLRPLLVDQGVSAEVTHDVEAICVGFLARSPDAVILASRRCGRGLLDAVALVHSGAPTAGMVAVCERIGGNDARSLLAAGAQGLVISRDADQTLWPTLQAVAAGQVCVPQRHASRAERPGLSTREKQVIGLVALGFSNGEIADRLFVTESTVKSHLSSSFTKLGVRSRHEAVELIVNPAFGLSNGIMSLGAEPIDVLRAAAAVER
jgi:DNA-binding NarL/FixJ family response regulator